MRFRFVEENRAHFPANRLCDIVGVSTRGLRAFLSRPASRRQRSDMVTLAHIKEQSRLSLGSYVRNRQALLVRFDQPDNLRLGKTALSHSSAPSRLSRLYIIVRDFAGGRSQAIFDIHRLYIFAGRKEKTTNIDLSVRGWDGLFDCNESPKLYHKIGFPSVGTNFKREVRFRELHGFLQLCGEVGLPATKPRSANGPSQDITRN